MSRKISLESLREGLGLNNGSTGNTNTADTNTGSRKVNLDNLMSNYETYTAINSASKFSDDYNKLILANNSTQPKSFISNPVIVKNEFSTNNSGRINSQFIKNMGEQYKTLVQNDYENSPVNTFMTRKNSYNSLQLGNTSQIKKELENDLQIYDGVIKNEYSKLTKLGVTDKTSYDELVNISSKLNDNDINKVYLNNLIKYINEKNKTNDYYNQVVAYENNPLDATKSNDYSNDIQESSKLDDMMNKYSKDKSTDIDMDSYTNNKINSTMLNKDLTSAQQNSVQSIEQRSNEIEKTRKTNQGVVNVNGKKIDFDEYQKHYGYYNDKQLWNDVNKTETQQNQQFAQEHPVLASAASIGYNLLTPVDTLLSGKSMLEDIKNGKDVEFDSNTLIHGNARDTIRNTVSEDIYNNIEDKNMAEIAGFAYSTGMSMADSASTYLLPPGVRNAVFGSSAGTSAAKQATERGASATDAVLTGVCAGVAEILFESVSLGQLKLFAQQNKAGLKSTVKNIAKGFVTEGSEEAATDICNAITDKIINGDLSDLSVQKQQMIDNGVSEAEANSEVAKNFALQLGTSFLGGAISGGIMSAGASAVGNYRYNSQANYYGKDLNIDDINAIISEGLSKDKSTDAYKAALKLQEKQEAALNGGEAITQKEIGALTLEIINSPVNENNIDKNKVETNDNLNLSNINNTDVANKINKTQNTVMQSTAQNNITNNSIVSGKSTILPAATDLVTANNNTESSNNVQAFPKFKNGLAAKDSNGKAVKVTKINSVEDGKVNLELVDGTVKTNEEIKIINPQMKSLINMASDFDSNGAKAFVANYESYEKNNNNPNMQDYAESFSKLYDAGRSGIEYNAAIKNIEMSTISQRLGINAAMNAVNSGLNDYNATIKLQQQRQNIENKLSSGKVVIDDNVNLPENEGALSQIFALDNVAKVAKTNIVITKKLTDTEKQANAFYKDGTIYINANKLNEGVKAYTYHEAGHMIKENNPAGFAVLQKFVMNLLAENGIDFNDRIKEIQKSYSKVQTLSRENAIEEIVCNSLMTIATDEQATKIADKLTTEEKHTLIDVLKDFYNKVKELIKGLSKNAPEVKIMLENVENIRKLAEILEESLEENKNLSLINDNNTHYLIAKDTNNENVVVLENDVFDNKEGKTHQIIANSIAEHIGEYYKIIESGQKIFIGKDLPGEFTQSEYTKNLLKTKKHKIINNKNQTTQNIKEIIQISTNRKWEKSTKKKHETDAKYGFYKYTSRIAVPKRDSYGNVINFNIYKIQLVIRNDVDGKKYLYDIQNIKKESSSALPAPWVSKVRKNNLKLSDTKIPQDNNDVNSNYMQKEEKVTRDGKAKLLYLGEQAETANVTTLDEAKQLSENSKLTNEDIRQKTGWFKGMDGKWRFEINDNDFKFKLKGYVDNPTTLADYIKHDELFEAYPQLKNIKIIYEMNIGNENEGSYSSKENVIRLNYLKPKAEIKKSLLHEIQHVIQEKEGFSSGASQKYWKQRLKDGHANNIKGLQINNVEKRMIEIYSSLPQEVQEQLNEWKESVIKKDFNNAQQIENNLMHGEYRAKTSEYLELQFSKELLKQKNDELLALQLYYNTAGEIEARDTEERMDYAKRQRKNTRPDIDRTDVVFADSGNSSSTNTSLSKHVDNDIKFLLDEVKFSLDKTSDINDDIIDIFEDSDMKIAQTFKATNETVKELLDKTKDVKISQKAVNDIARKYINEYDSKYTIENFSNNIQRILDFIENSENEYDSNQLVEVLATATKPVIENSGVLIDLFANERGEIRSFLRSFDRVHLTEGQLASANFGFDGGLREIKQKLFGTVNIVKQEKYKKSTALDIVWMDLAEQYPHLFDSDLQSEEQPRRLMEILETIKPYYENQYDMNTDEAAVELAQKLLVDIIDTKYNISGYKSKKYSDYKQKLRVQMQSWKNEVKSNYNKKLSSIKADDIKQLRKIKDKYKKANAEDRKYYQDMYKRLQDRYSSNNKEQIQKLKAHNKKVREDAVERRHRSEMIEKTRRLINGMSKAIAKPRGDVYVPQGLINACIEIGKIIVVNSDGSVPKSGYEHFMKLKAEYDKIKNDSNYDNYSTDSKDYNIYGSEYNKSISENIEVLAELFENRSLKDMNAFELQSTYILLKDINDNIKKAVEVIIDGEKKNVYEIGTDIINEFAAVKGSKNRGLDTYVFSVLDPVRAAERMVNYKTDSKFVGLFKDFDKATKNAEAIKQGGQKILDNVLLKHRKELIKFEGESAELIDIGLYDQNTGENVKITKSMLISLHLHNMNMDNIRHIEKGGVVVPDIKLYKQGRMQDAYSKGHKVIVSQQKLNQISEIVGKNKMYSDVASAIGELLNQYTPQFINDTSMKLKGYKLTMNDFYFPIHTDSNFLNQDFDTIVGDFSLENSGFTKRRVFSKNPIYLNDCINEAIRSLNNSAIYSAFAIPIHNFNKVYNVVTENYTTSVKKSLNEKWGTIGSDYIKNILTDLQGRPSNRDKEINYYVSKLRGNIIKSALIVNTNAAVKQFSAYFNGAYVVGWKPLGQALKEGIHRADADLIKKYSSLFWTRTQGNISPAINETIKATNDWDSKLVKHYPKAQYLTDWLEKLDIATVGRLWSASEYYVQDNFSDLKIKSEDYYRKVADVFDDIITKTQSNYTTIHRPSILRNPETLFKSMLLFMTQSFQQQGILIEANGNYFAKRNAFKKADTEKTREEYNLAKKQLTRAISSQVVSSIALSVLSVVAAALLHRMDPYKDEDGELTALSLVSGVFNGFVSAMFDTFWGIGDLYSLIESFVNNEKYYGPNLPVLSQFNNIAVDLKNLIWAENKMAAIENSAYDISSLFSGLPVENVSKILKAIYFHFEDIAKNEFGSFNAGSKIKPTESDYGENMYDALMDGNDVEYNKWYKKAVEAGKEDKVQSLIKNALVQNEPLIKQMYEAYFENGNLKEYNEILESLINKGFVSDTVTGAVSAYYKKEKNKKSSTEKTVDSSADDSQSNNDKSSKYNYDMLFDALITNNKSNYNQIQKELLKSGKTASGIKSAIASRKEKLLQEYIDGGQQDQGIYKQLIYAYGSQTAVRIEIQKLIESKK